MVSTGLEQMVLILALSLIVPSSAATMSGTGDEEKNMVESFATLTFV